MQDNNSNEELDRKIDFARTFMRKDRPLPKSGCSWAFFIFLGLLALGVAAMYGMYKLRIKN